MKIVIIGATSGVGRSLLYKLSSNSENQFLIAARDIKTMSVLKSDIEITTQSFVSFCQLDLLSKDSINGFIHDNYSFLVEAEVLLVTAGLSLDTDYGVDQIDQIETLVSTNYLSICIIIQNIIRINTASLKSISVLSSVAAHSERATNIIYASAKKGLEQYLQSLRSFVYSRKLAVNIFVLGYIDTKLARGKKLPLPVANPDEVAGYIIKQFRNNKGIVYYPKFWIMVIIVLSFLPISIKSRLKS